MTPRRRLGKKLVKTFLPIVLVLALALVVVSGWIIHGVTRPPRRAYLVTPQAFREISGPVLKVSDETWANLDGTPSRGWLLKGAPGAPAVILLHRYSADRSWLFNLGVKLNEATDFTILWPDLRGHGLSPPIESTSFGTKEAEDVMAAMNFLRTLKTGKGGNRLIGTTIGLYGVELGAYAALRVAPEDDEVKVLVLDSIPASPDQLLRAVVKERYELDNNLLDFFVRTAARIYLGSSYQSRPSCELASQIKTQKVLLLSGEDAGYLKQSTINLAPCFPNQANVEIKTDLPLTGFRLASATGEQGEGYDRRVIDYFDKNLR
jgi:pimeloyl-ACP methyl ester carboxylesterase